MIRKNCPACDNATFMLETDVEEFQVRCAECGNATALADKQNAAIDNRL